MSRKEVNRMKHIKTITVAKAAEVDLMSVITTFLAALTTFVLTMKEYFQTP
jgi:hypothetical protein